MPRGKKVRTKIGISGDFNFDAATKGKVAWFPHFSRKQWTDLLRINIELSKRRRVRKKKDNVSCLWTFVAVDRSFRSSRNTKTVEKQKRTKKTRQIKERKRKIYTSLWWDPILYGECWTFLKYKIHFISIRFRRSSKAFFKLLHQRIIITRHFLPHPRPSSLLYFHLISPKKTLFFSHRNIRAVLAQGFNFLVNYFPSFNVRRKYIPINTTYILLYFIDRTFYFYILLPIVSSSNYYCFNKRNNIDRSEYSSAKKRTYRFLM